ncbi:MAG: YggS family pyridoxal phosphate-dependent enzyme [Planctomycetota bacterium]
MEPQEIQTLEVNLRQVRTRIRAACHRAGRSEDEVRLVAVTKYTTAEVIEALATLGVTDVGESRVQDTWQKQESLGRTRVRWHLIGHLQRNKAARALELYDLIHSLDSRRLAEELESKATAPVDALLQVNVSGESSKGGFRPEELDALLAEASSWSRLRIRGLMTMAPHLENPSTTDSVRPIFRDLRELRDDANRRSRYRDQLVHLSMGMTQDFETAIEEGATWVRVGSALLDGLETTPQKTN